MKIEYQCSNCGKRERVSVMVGIPEGMFALGYRAVGDALYCTDCVNSWAERNGKPFDEQYKDVGHMFAVWWNVTVLRKAKAEHKQLKEYCVNESGVVKTTTYCEVVARQQNKKNVTAAGLNCKARGGRTRKGNKTWMYFLKH